VIIPINSHMLCCKLLSETTKGGGSILTQSTFGLDSNHICLCAPSSAVSSIVRPGFFLSFYWWLDVVATVSLGFELPALRAALLLGATQVRGKEERAQAGAYRVLSAACGSWLQPIGFCLQPLGVGCSLYGFVCSLWELAAAD
jgi:hypothetical protein